MPNKKETQVVTVSLPTAVFTAEKCSGNYGKEGEHVTLGYMAQDGDSFAQSIFPARFNPQISRLIIEFLNLELKERGLEPIAYAWRKGERTKRGRGSDGKPVTYWFAELSNVPAKLRIDFTFEVDTRVSVSQTETDASPSEESFADRLEALKLAASK